MRKMEFSLEKISERIHFGKTNEYFKEVLSSYQNGNYRSSVVMLWSVAVCDIIYKLQHLIDLYDDGSAREILLELTALQLADPKSSAWEVKLVDDVYNKTNLFDGAEHENLRYLQKQRHLSAHPILNHDRDLHTPNKETVRSLLRNTLEGLLIKPPFYTQKIFDELLADVAENTEALNTYKKVKQYIESRYLRRLTPDVELQIYRSLWKVVFKLENVQCETHRKLNLHVIEIIGKRNAGQLKQLIEGEQDYFSNVAGNGWPVVYLVFYLSKNHLLYELLSEDAKLKVKHCIETDNTGRSQGWFVKDSLESHFNDLIEWIEGADHPSFVEGQLRSLLEISDSSEWQAMFCKLVGAYYAASLTYDQADKRFKDDLQPWLHFFPAEAIEFLLPKIELNNQTYRRGMASHDHPKIINRIEELDADIDISVFREFAKTAKEDDEV
jgi:hypothetical protein